MWKYINPVYKNDDEDLWLTNVILLAYVLL